MRTATLPRPATAATRVFVVEDSPLVRERLEAMLATIEGTQAVGVAATAHAAIEGILAARPDVVVLDLRLAEGSGFDVLRALRSRSLAVDVYMLSNFAEAPYRRLAARLGAQGYFDKSTEFEHVREALVARTRRHASQSMH